jgi:hypothetical protein
LVLDKKGNFLHKKVIDHRGFQRLSMNEIKKGNNQSLISILERVLEAIKDKEVVSLGQLLNILSRQGYAVILIMISLPFCLPVQIPGFSTPFGLLLAFLGLQIAFSKSLWWPQWLLKKTLKTHKVKHTIEKSMKTLRWLQKIVHPRLLVFIQNPFLQRLNGLVICVLALFLSLPLILPMSNMVFAFPILCMGLGLLEDDGLFILIGYIFALIMIIFTVWLFLFGFNHIKEWLF